MKLDNDAYQAVSSILLTNGGFENGLTGWTILNTNGATISANSVATEVRNGTGAMKVINPTARPGNQWMVQVTSAAFPTTIGKQYTISYWVKAASAGGSIRLSSGPSGAQYQGDQTIGTSWQQVSWTITASLTSTTFLFDMGQVANTYYIDDAVVREAGTGGWGWTKLKDAPLSIGMHTLTVGYRDGNVQMDKLLVTTFSNAITGTGDAAINCVILPVTLLKFDGNLAGGKVQLKWNTVNEVNIQNYEIERSTDNKDFKKIGAVAATNSLINNQYAFDDASVSSNTQYYRLRVVDKDGNVKYSNTILVLLKKSSGLVLLPNPVTSNLFITHDKAGNNASVFILSAVGSKVLNIKVVSESTQTTINTSNLVPGTYFLQYISNGKMQTQKFSKQ